MPTARRSTPANADHAAPATIAATIMSTSVSEPFALAPRPSDTPMAAMPPMSSCPSPPTLMRPARAGTATARPARISGVAFTRMLPMPDHPENVEVIMSL